MPRSLPSLLLLALSVAGTPPARADTAATICRGPTTGPVRVIGAGVACTGFVIRAGRRDQARIEFGRLASGHLLVSKSGRTVAMVDSYLHARIAGGRIETIDWSPVVNPPVVTIYRDGEKVATHHIHDLLGARPAVRTSISHIQWVAELPASIGERTFTLRTLSGLAITFDSASGRIVKKRTAG